MQNQESIGELSECLEFIRGAFPSFGLQFKTVFGLISLFKRYRMGDEIEKLLKHENIPLLDENQVTNAEYMDILHRSRGQFYAEIEQLAQLQVIHWFIPVIRGMEMDNLVRLVYETIKISKMICWGPF